MSFRRGVGIADGFIIVAGIAAAVMHYARWLWLDILAGVVFGFAALGFVLFVLTFVAWKLFAWVVDDGRP